MKRDVSVAQIGVDVHKVFSTVTARGEGQKVVWRERLNHRDRAALRVRLAGWPTGVPVILEGTFGWGWLADEMQEAGLDVRLANSRKVAGWRDVRGLAKSNRTDADLLSALPLEGERWWEVWLPPQDVRDQRECLRYRMQGVAMQTQIKNRIHAVLHRHGILCEVSNQFGVAGRRFLNQLVAPEDVTLREGSRKVLRNHLETLDHVRGQIAQATRWFRHWVQANPDANRLRTIPGIAWILAYTLAAEIGRIERFRNGKHLASYSLLVPRANDTGEPLGDGEIPLGRHVGRIGRRTLKWAYIEAAHTAVRCSDRFAAIFDQRTNGGKRDKNRGYIAVAHALCDVSYIVLKKGVAYTEDPPARPGRRS